MPHQSNNPDVLPTAQALGQATTAIELRIHTAKNSRNTTPGIDDLFKAIDDVAKHARNIDKSLKNGGLNLAGEEITEKASGLVNNVAELVRRAHDASGVTPGKDANPLTRIAPTTKLTSLPTETYHALKKALDNLQPKAQEINRALLVTYQIAPDTIQRNFA